MEGKPTGRPEGIKEAGCCPARCGDSDQTPRVYQFENQGFVEVGTWQIRKLRQRPIIEFYPWKAPESTPNGPPERQHVNRDPLALAHFYQTLLDNGIAETRAELARYLGVSRARVTQVLRRLKKTSRHADQGDA